MNLELLATSEAARYTEQSGSGHTGLFPDYPVLRGSRTILEPLPDSVTQSPAWGGQSPDTIRRALIDADVGIASTPALLGKHLLFASWGWMTGPDGRLIATVPRHSKPPRSVAQLLKQYSRGQRIEGKRPSGTPDVDIPSAWPSHFRRLPTGTVRRVYEEPPEWEWFMACRIFVPRRLALGPFPIKDGKRVTWPREPGFYESWLWRGQAEDARDAGCRVTPQRGIAWPRVTEDTAPFIDDILDRRKQAMLAGDWALANVWKRAANMTIGTCGIGWQYPREVPNWEPGARYVCDPRAGLSGAGKWVIVRPGRMTMVHWALFSIMEAGRTLYRMALPHAERGELAALYCDQLYLKGA